MNFLKTCYLGLAYLISCGNVVGAELNKRIGRFLRNLTIQDKKEQFLGISGCYGNLKHVDKLVEFLMVNGNLSTDRYPPTFLNEIETNFNKNYRADNIVN